MQAVVPSQVVAVLLGFFPRVKEPEPLQLYSGQLPQLMAIVRLVRRVPPQLFTVPVEQYIELEFAIEVIEQTLKRSEREALAFPIPPMGGGSPVQLMYNVLTACPDSVPASSAVNLGFIEDAKTRFENFNRLRDIAEQRRSSLFSIPRDNPVSLWPVSFTRDV